MSENARIRVNKISGEIEISGSETFVKENISVLHSLLGVAQTEAPATTVANKGIEKDEKTTKGAKRGPKKGSKRAGRPKKINTDMTFEAYLNQYPEKVRKGDLILAAGYYHQSKDPDQQFTTFNTSKLLKKLEIKLANPSQYVKNNINSKRLKALDKRSYRVTPIGVRRLSHLISQNKA